MIREGWMINCIGLVHYAFLCECLSFQGGRCHYTVPCRTTLREYVLRITWYLLFYNQSMSLAVWLRSCRPWHCGFDGRYRYLQGVYCCCEERVAFPGWNVLHQSRVSVLSLVYTAYQHMHESRALVLQRWTVDVIASAITASFPAEWPMALCVIGWLLRPIIVYWHYMHNTFFHLLSVFGQTKKILGSWKERIIYWWMGFHIIERTGRSTLFQSYIMSLCVHRHINR